MLGRRNPQRNLFEAQNWPHRVPPESFYARMGEVNDQLFADDDLAELYCPDNGRPSVPPSLLSGVLLLQFYDDVSDQEAVEHILFDLRWKVALHLSLDEAPFDPSTLCHFRQRLIQHGKERYAFDRLIAVARASGFLPDKVTLLTDTTWAKGAGAVQDTYTLIRKSIRQLLHQMGYGVAQKRRGLAPEIQRLLATYLDQDDKADIDWTDAQQRAAELKVLVQDAEATLDLAAEHPEDAEVRSTGWLLTKILGDDVVTDEQGDPQIGEGTAPDRILSVTDPEMRYGHKSRAQRFEGFKVAVTTEPTSELIVDIADVPAPGSDGQHLPATVERIEQNTGVEVERVIGDGAHGAGANRAWCAEHSPHPIDLVAPLARPPDPAVHKSAFQIDLAAHQATCPEGHTVTGRAGPPERGRPTWLFHFRRQDCQFCPLFTRCVRSRTAGRTVRTKPFESYLQAARQRQSSAEFKELYRMRSRVERKQAELVRHGIRRTRYLGQVKRQLQRLWTGAVVNLKRLFKLIQSAGHALRLRALFAASEPPRLRLAARYGP